MRAHVDALGWLYIIWGAFGLLTGVSLGVLAGGTALAIRGGPESPAAHPAVWLLVLFGALLLLTGVVAVGVGRAVVGRRRYARLAALALAVPTVLVVPFGSALSIYTFWVLLNDEARREFVRADTISP